MEILLFPFVLLIAVPGLPFGVTALFAWWTKRKWRHMGGVARLSAGSSLVLWFLYSIYETAMYFWMQTVIAPIRVDLLLFGPLLMLAGLAIALACLTARSAPATTMGDA